MSNFTVNKIYSYSSANIYTYLGKTPSNDLSLQRAFEKYHITPKGEVDDLKKLGKAMYQDFNTQVLDQIANQNRNEKDVVPWSSICQQIGVPVSDDVNKARSDFYQALGLLSQSAYDGQTMAFFASLRSEADRIFGKFNPDGQNQKPAITFEQFRSQII